MDFEKILLWEDDPDYPNAVMITGFKEHVVFDAPEIDLMIPEKINGRTVTSIGPYAFRGSFVSSPIREIADLGAIPTFLRSIIFPKTLKKISKGAFGSCKTLTSIRLPEELEYIGEEAFEGCASLAALDLPDGLKALGEGAFNGCSSLVSVVLPDALERIAFHEGCAYRECGVFCNCSSLKEIRASSRNENCQIENGALFYGSELIAYPSGRTETHFDVPEGTWSIKGSAFANCESLQTISFPEELVYVQQYAFAGCSSLTSVEFKRGLWGIYRGAFEGCSSLQSVALPEGLAHLSKSVFGGCDSLSRVWLPESLEEIGDWAFDFDSPNCVFYVVEGSVGEKEAQYMKFPYVSRKSSKARRQS